MYRAVVLADSISNHDVRLTTFEVEFPRFLLAEFNTHRMLSRNAASSRAIPVKRRVAAIEADPFIPEVFGSNRKGMQAGKPLAEWAHNNARGVWMSAMHSAINHALGMEESGVHKQHANRLLEPFAWVTVVASATHWDNFFHLRCHPDAQPEFQKVATMMRAEMEDSLPARQDYHLPYVTGSERIEWSNQNRNVLDLMQVSAARCARVSYTAFDGTTSIDADLELARKLLKSGHLSPFEHPAHVQMGRPHWDGNFFGWRQYRKRISAEDDRLGPRGLGSESV